MEQIASDMVLDTEYDEKQAEDVHIISTDDSMDEPEPEPELRADDLEAMKKRYLPDLPDLEIEAEGVDTWDIQNWRSLSRREHGPVFDVGGHPWRVLFFPQGNNVDHASFYLEHGFEEKPSEDWYACVQFMLILWNPNDPTIHISHTATHRFTAEEGDWGFTRFAELRRIFASHFDDRDRPMVEDGSAKMTAYVRVIKDPTGVLWHNFLNYDSKKETGMVGLKNQGATCYLNSLLQSLYFTTAFRKVIYSWDFLQDSRTVLSHAEQAVYQIPTESEVDYRANSAYALQRLFYQLQTNSTAVSTHELTGAFGWDSKQIFEQQDVQELSRVLMERLEERMKGTDAENALARMFVGKMKTYISCINIEFESSRMEEFWDLQLNVNGIKGLEDSFKDYIAQETMDGENQYQAEGYGLQDAKKGVIFESFPAVLHLQLKRFEFDFAREINVKINDRFEFPEILDLSPYLSDDADKSEPYVYHLHGVLVHSGDISAGHYYAFLKPHKNGEFFKFDDDRVTRATKKEAIDDNFGGEYSNLPNGYGQRNPYTRQWSTKRSMNAYMLVYIRESRLDEVLLSDEDVDPPPHLAKKIAEERAVLEKRRKEREEAHLYMEIQAATIENFRAHQGFDIVAFKGEASSVEAIPKLYRILRSTPLGEFLKNAAADLGLQPEAIRAWAMVNRQNGTVRPDLPIMHSDMTVEEASQKYGTKSAAFRIFLESSEESDAEGKPIWGDSAVDTHSNPNNKPILLFLKCFDIDAQVIHGVGLFYAAPQDKVQDIAPTVLKLMGWTAGQNFKMSEEIKNNMIEPMKPKQTLQQSEIQDGDIITVQKVLSEKEQQALQAKGLYTEARDFYDYLLHRINVKFVARNAPDDEAKIFELTLTKRMNYQQLAQRVGEYLGVDPTYLRFCPVNAQTGRAKNPIRHTTNHNLGTILSPGYSAYGAGLNQRNDALYYEVLEVSMSELEMRKTFKVTWLPEGIVKEEPYDILVPKNGTVEDIIHGLQKKAELSDDIVDKIRVFEAHGAKLHRLCAPTYPVSNLNDYTQLYMEPTPPEDFQPQEDEGLIAAFHFDKDVSKAHGVPFIFLLKQGELFKDTKERISKRTGLKGKQFEKIKFAVVQRSAYAKPDYLNDDDVLAEKLINRDDMLGLDHPSKARRDWLRADSIMIPHLDGGAKTVSDAFASLRIR